MDYPCSYFFLPLNPDCTDSSVTTTTSTTTVYIIPCLTYQIYVKAGNDPIIVEFENCDGTESSTLIVYPEVTIIFCAILGTVHIEGSAQAIVLGVCPTTTTTTSSSTTTSTSTTSSSTTTSTSTTSTTTTTSTTAFMGGYGALYNFFIVEEGATKKIASSDDWVIPTKTNIETLVSYIGGSSSGYKLRDSDSYWENSHITPSTNEFGFNGRGSGYRYGTFQYLKVNCYMMSSTVRSYSYTPYQSFYGTYFNGNVNSIVTSDGTPFQAGTIIRLLKTSTTLTHGQTGTYTGNDGQVYDTICIGTQEWLAYNLSETKYRNGNWIKGFDGGVYTPIANATWDTLTTGAMCYYNNDINNK